VPPLNMSCAHARVCCHASTMAPTTWSSSRPVRASSKLRPGASVGWPTSTTTARSFCASGSQPTMSFTTSASGSITTTCMSSAATAWWTRCWASELFFTDAVAPPKDRRRVVESWDVADVQRFLHAAAGDRRYGPVWLVALHTDMRRGELLGLRWQDVDLDTGVLHVRQALSVVSTDDGPRSRSVSPRRTAGGGPSPSTQPASRCCASIVRARSSDGWRWGRNGARGISCSRTRSADRSTR